MIAQSKEVKEMAKQAAQQWIAQSQQKLTATVPLLDTGSLDIPVVISRYVSDKDETKLKRVKKSSKSVEPILTIIKRNETLLC